MTTSVIIRANHGWPVRATQQHLNSADGSIVSETPVVIPAGEERTLYVHSTMDLLIHEIQPSEVADG